MSRGGRGGWGKQRMGNVELPWDYDPNLKIDFTPSEEYPPIARPATQKPPRNIELRQLAHFRRLRSRIHEGPFHAVLGGRSARVEKTTPIAAAPRYDAFEGMPSYTQKYIKQRRRIPRLDSRTYITRFFPEELRALVDPSLGAATNGGVLDKSKKRKGVKAMRSNHLSRLEAEMPEDGRENPHDPSDPFEDVPGQVKGDSDQEVDEERPEEPQDDDFVEDEEDLDDDNDYNAEKYFDDGENDYGGEDDLGGGGGGEEWGD